MEIHLLGSEGEGFKEIEKELLSALKGFHGFMEFQKSFSHDAETRLKGVGAVNLQACANFRNSEVKIFGDSNDPIVNAVGIFICANRMHRELVMYLEKSCGWPTGKAQAALQVLVDVAKNLEHSMEVVQEVLPKVAKSSGVPKSKLNLSHLPQMPKRKSKPKKENTDE